MSNTNEPVPPIPTPPAATKATAAQSTAAKAPAAKATATPAAKAPAATKAATTKAPAAKAPAAVAPIEPKPVTPAPASPAPAAAAPANPAPDAHPYGPAPVVNTAPRGLSIASMVTGIVGLIFGFVGFGLLPSLAAVITGHLAQRRQPESRAYWLTGLITGYIGIGIALIFGIVILIALIAWFGLLASYSTNPYSG